MVIAEGAWEGICGVAQDPSAFGGAGAAGQAVWCQLAPATEQPARLPRQWQSGALHNLGLAKQA